MITITIMTTYLDLDNDFYHAVCISIIVDNTNNKLSHQCVGLLLLRLES